MRKFENKQKSFLQSAPEYWISLNFQPARVKRLTNRVAHSSGGSLTELLTFLIFPILKILFLFFFYPFENKIDDDQQGNNKEATFYEKYDTSHYFNFTAVP